MHRLLALLALAAIPLADQAAAQQPAVAKAPRDKGGHSAVAPAQDSAQFYTQPPRRTDDAAEAVRRKAQFRAQQRMRRLAARKWFGMSKSRPTASATPWAGIYSPVWVSNTGRPFAWSGHRQPVVVTRSDASLRR